MSETTPGGWPFVTEDDFVVEWPLVSEQLATLLDTRTARASSATTRGANADAAAGVSLVLAGPTTVTAAPAGLYIVAVTGSIARNGGSGTAITINLQVGGVNIQTTILETTDDLRRNVHLSMVHPHPGGDLVAQATAAGNLAPIRAFSGSRVWVARVSL